MTTATQEKPKCPKCGSSEVRYRRTDKITWCRVCGAEWPKAKK